MHFKTGPHGIKMQQMRPQPDGDKVRRQGIPLPENREQSR